MTDFSRKKEHVDLTANGRANYLKTTGLEKYDFWHNPLPELNFKDIDTSKSFLGRKFRLPLFISSMTGGYSGAQAVNEIIAQACEDWNLPFGVGSQRVMLKDKKQTSSFSIVRKKAPKSFIAANIGGVQLIKDVSFNDILGCIDSIEANALIIHLNPLQELMQIEGDRSFKGILSAIEKLTSTLKLPVIVKETGAGIDFKTAKWLSDVGVRVIDIAGAGGTSWSKVETLRSNNERFSDEFNEWGNPLALCLETFKGRNKSDFELMASGGIKTPFDSLKSLALGADFTAIAQPIIKTIVESGIKGLYSFLRDWEDAQMKIQLLIGVASFEEISANHVYKIKNLD